MLNYNAFATSTAVANVRLAFGFFGVISAEAGTFPVTQLFCLIRLNLRPHRLEKEREGEERSFFLPLRKSINFYWGPSAGAAFRL